MRSWFVSTQNQIAFLKSGLSKSNVASISSTSSLVCGTDPHKAIPIHTFFFVRGSDGSTNEQQLVVGKVQKTTAF